MDNLSRFNEEEESDRQGIFHVLGEYGPLQRCPSNTHPFQVYLRTFLGSMPTCQLSLFRKRKFLIGC